MDINAGGMMGALQRKMAPKPDAEMPADDAEEKREVDLQHVVDFLESLESDVPEDVPKLEKIISLLKDLIGGPKEEEAEGEMPSKSKPVDKLGELGPTVGPTEPY